MDYKDYYKIMGLERGASDEEIKRAYRKLARKYHPDVSKMANAEEKFKELGEAYAVLSEPEKRAKYDQYGQYWQQQGQGGYGPQEQSAYSANFGDSVNPADFEDFLNSIFRGRYQQQREAHFDQGRDVHAKLTITLEDSFKGAEKILQLQTPVEDNRGHIHYQTRAVKVKLPKGIGDKQQIRLKGQGDKGLGGRPGDLYIEITLAHHPWFRLQKKDLHLQVPLAPWEAALGATIQVPTLAGPVSLKIPKLSQSGKKMRLKGRGLPGNPAGDQYVHLEIVIPVKEDATMEALYQQMANTVQFNPRQKWGVS